MTRIRAWVRHGLAPRQLRPGGRWRLLLLLLAGVAPGWAAEGDGRAAGLVAAWSFEKIDGRRVADDSGQGNEGLIGSAVVVKGIRGQALQLEGAGATMRCPDSGSLRPGPAITIEAWVKLGQARPTAYASVVRKERCYALRFGNGRLALVLWLNGTPVYLDSRRDTWAADQWLYLVGTYDGTQMRLFIDGQEDANSPRAQSGPVDTEALPCYIGACAGQYPLNGTVDEVRIYDRALDPKEILVGYEKGKQALAAEAAVTVKPRAVGAVEQVFRKPPRVPTMVQDGFLWLDAEDFAEYGGWSLDTQFVHLLGSAYLVAAGLGTPVADAGTDVEVPRAGTYRLWVRARNWLKDHAPGQFTVLVNGRPSQVRFGAGATDQWVWEAGGDFELPQGRVRLALHDLTGYYARCDALILSSDPGYVPPAPLEALQKERSRLTGLSLEPRPGGEYDVIVVGAGAAGSVAALAAARLGAKTALVQNRPVLGGNASSEMGVPLNGASVSHPQARESGIVEEVGRVQARYGFSKVSEAFAMMAAEEKNLTVLLNQHVIAVTMADKSTIAAVRALDTLTGELTDYRGRLFIDCTGDGWVGYYAGATFRFGRESRAEFNESLAPEKPDQITMSGCLMGPGALGFRAENTGKPVPYTPPPWAPTLATPETFRTFGRSIRHVASGEWWLEHPGDIDDLWEPEKARDELIRISFGYWDYIKNVWPDRAQAANYALVNIPILDAKRETRRLVGDYILNQNDIQNGVIFPDRVSYGGWPLDVHHPRGIFSGKDGPFHCNPAVPLYTIPFRSLYSVNIGNLLFAGRDMSVTHIALGSVRVQSTLATLGQAVGTAAAMCLQRGLLPRDLGQRHITDLQQTLVKHDLYIPEVANQDPLDLARTAKVSASSTATYEEFTRDRVCRGRDTHPLNMDRAMMFPAGVNRELRSVSLLLASERDQPADVAVHLRGSETPGDFSSTVDLAVAKASVRPNTEAWARFRLEHTSATPFVWVWVEPLEGIAWRLMESAPPGACRAYGNAASAKWTVVKGQYYTLITDPPRGVTLECPPGNVTNGLTRPVGDKTNLWCSDPTQPLPQWVEIDFGKPTPVNSVYVTFDTDLNTRMCDVPLVPQCVREYQLAVHDGQAWVPVATETGNYQRRRVHRFPVTTTARLRLTVTATNGDRSARVFEVRAYNE